MFKCRDCKAVTEYEYLKEQKGCFEEDYGVAILFESKTKYSKKVCPECGSEEIEEAIQCWDCQEYFLESELNYNQDNNLVCKDCEEE